MSEIAGVRVVKTLKMIVNKQSCSSQEDGVVVCAGMKEEMGECRIRKYRKIAYQRCGNDKEK